MSVIRRAVTGGREQPERQGPAAKGNSPSNSGPFARGDIAMFFRLIYALSSVPASVILTLYAIYRHSPIEAQPTIFENLLVSLAPAASMLVSDWVLIRLLDPNGIRETAPKLLRIDVRITYCIVHLLAHVYAYENGYERVLVWVGIAVLSTGGICMCKLFARVEDSSALAFEVFRQSFAVAVLLLIHGHGFQTREIVLILIPAIPAIVALLTPEDELYKEFRPVAKHIPAEDELTRTSSTDCDSNT